MSWRSHFIFVDVVVIAVLVLRVVCLVVTCVVEVLMGAVSASRSEGDVLSYWCQESSNRVSL